MAEITGVAASVVSGATVIAGAHDWKLDIDSDMLECTDYADAGVKSFTAGNTGWGGSLEFRYDTAQPPHTDPPNLNEGQTLTCKFYITAVKYYLGDVIISSVAVSTPQADYITYSVSFQGTGALDKTNL